MVLTGTGEGESRRIHNEELFEMYSSPHIIGEPKLRRMRWTGMQNVLGREKCIKHFSGEI